VAQQQQKKDDFSFFPLCIDKTVPSSKFGFFSFSWLLHPTSL
jgi:hypothetical protein